MVRATINNEVECVEIKKDDPIEGDKDNPVEIEIITPDIISIKEQAKTQMDFYKESLEYEESEVSRRPAHQDQKLFLDTCGSVRSLMEEILTVKNAQGDQVAEEVETKRVQIMMLMLNMRKLSRTQKVRVRLAREGALESRQSVDGVTLQLQGLLYEVLHLQKEAQRCLLAHTADKEIELLPLEQFYQQAPDTISRPEVTLDDPHQQRLARLHWELEQRRGQTSLSDQLTQEQQQVQQQIMGHQEQLTALAPRINTILQSTVPLQEALNLPLAAMREQQDTALMLPMPLYTLWMQTSAYSEAGDPLVCCIIRGDGEAAKRLRSGPDPQAVEEKPEEAAAASAALDVSAVDSDNDAEDSSDVTSHKSRGRGGRTASNKPAKEVITINSTAAAATPTLAAATVAAADPMKQMLALHPLHVEVTISVPDGSRVVVQFNYAMELRLITTRCLVIAKDRPTVPGAVVLTDMLSSIDFLDCLFPDDSGVISPNPATAHQLRRLQASKRAQQGTAPAAWEPVIPPEIGRAYMWAQLLAGLAFPFACQEEAAGQGALLAEMAEDMEVERKEDAAQSVSSQVSSERVHVTLSAIRRRLRSRLALQHQLLALQSASSTSAIPVSGDSVKDLFPLKVSSELLSWRPITWRDYATLPCTAALREAGLASDRCLYFRALYQRRHVNMGAYVCMSPDYPQTVPLFALEIKWGEQMCPYAHVQQLEAEVNVHWDELVVGGSSNRAQVLPLMLYRLAMCLDVYTEAASSRLVGAEVAHTQTDAQHFQKEKIFFRPARGPDRAFPLKYLPKLRVFAQR